MIKTMKQYNDALTRLYEIFDAEPGWNEHLKLVDDITEYEDAMNFGIAPAE